MVLSYSVREETLRARLSLMRAKRSVRMRRSFWILAVSTGAIAHAHGLSHRCAPALARPKPHARTQAERLRRGAVGRIGNPPFSSSSCAIDLFSSSLFSRSCKATEAQRTEKRAA